MIPPASFSEGQRASQQPHTTPCTTQSLDDDLPPTPPAAQGTHSTAQPWNAAAAAALWSRQQPPWAAQHLGAPWMHQTMIRPPPHRAWELRAPSHPAAPQVRPAQPSTGPNNAGRQALQVCTTRCSFSFPHRLPPLHSTSLGNWSSLF